MLNIEDFEITRTMETGYPKDPEWPICPICGSECDEVYLDKGGDIIGCDECVSIRNAYDCPECYKED